MQGPYEELRRAAAAKRDKIIQQARYEYHASLRRIKALHGMIAGDAKPGIGQPHRVREKSLTDLIRDGGGLFHAR